MDFIVVRAIVQYQDVKMGILFERSSSEKGIQKCLEEFQLVKDDWDQYDIINLQYQYKLRTSNHIRKEDEMLILKKKK